MEEQLRQVVEAQEFMRQTQRTINSLVDTCRRLVEEFSADKMAVDGDENSVSNAAAELSSIIEEDKLLETFSAGEKTLHAAINKLGKAIDNELECNPGKISFQVEFPLEIVNQLIVQHFLQHGDKETALKFAKESGVSLSPEDIQPFEELVQCTEALNARDYSLSIEWAQNNREKLSSIKSKLEYELLKHQFIELVASNRSSDALEFARSQLAQFMSTDLQREVQRLMGSLMYCGMIENSPYADLISTESRRQLINLFCRDYCRVLNIPASSTLLTCARVSSKCFGPLMKAKAIMEANQPGGWCAMTKLPIELPLHSDFHFHTIFSCPVSKELATSDNPPVMLPCGHVVAKRSIEELDAILSRPNYSRNRLKCPYCPTKLKLADVKQITF